MVVLAIGIVFVRPVLAQEEGTTTDPVVDQEITVDEGSTSAPSDSLQVAPDETTQQEDELSSVTNTEQPTTTPQEPPVAAPEGDAQNVGSGQSELTQASLADRLVEVQLKCTQSYMGTLYDTPTGHFEDGYYLTSRGSLAICRSPQEDTRLSPIPHLSRDTSTMRQ